MSDSPVSQEDIQWALAHNDKARAAAAGDEMLYLLGNGRPLHLVMEGLRDDADRAMAEFAAADLGNLAALQGLQARVFCFQRAFDTFNGIVERGGRAKAALQAEELESRE